MARAKNVADGLPVSIKCPKCGKMSQELLGGLIDKDVVPCGGCGHRINLRHGDARHRIEEVFREAARVQAALTKAGNRS